MAMTSAAVASQSCSSETIYAHFFPFCGDRFFLGFGKIAYAVLHVRPRAVVETSHFHGCSSTREGIAIVAFVSDAIIEMILTLEINLKIGSVCRSADEKSPVWPPGVN